MLKLATFARDRAAITDGVWIAPDERNHPELELRVKGRDSGYFDALSIEYRGLVRREREEGRLKARQGLDDLPVSVVQGVEDRLLLTRLVLEVRGLAGEDGKPLSIAAFRDLAVQEVYRPLLDLAREAVTIATERRAKDQDAAAGNSARSSGTAPSGAAPQN
jgi:hypothetical protein